MLEAFVDYIVESKTVMLEDLAAEFGLRVQVGQHSMEASLLRRSEFG